MITIRRQSIAPTKSEKQMPRPAIRHRELHLDRRIPLPKLRQTVADALQRCLRGKPLTGRAFAGKQRLDLAQLLA